MTVPRRSPATAALLLVALQLAACGGRDAWLNEPLPLRAMAVAPAPVSDDAPRVRLSTSVGDIVVALYPQRAPRSVENFLAYVDAGHYDGTIFHRVEPETSLPVIQGGGYDEELRARPTRAPIPIESDNGLSNVRGTLAMARRGDPDSATAQFFINYLDNPQLDYQGPSSWGYTVFGVVVEGMAVVDRITLVPTRAEPTARMQVLPMVPIVVESARREAR